MSVDPAEAVRSPVQSGLWGLGRVIGLEFPASWGGLVDVPDLVDAECGKRLTEVLASSGAEDQLAVRKASVFGRRLVRTAPAASRDARSRANDAGRDAGRDGVVLVTGGTGGIGQRVARWLADRGASDIVLASRSGAAVAGVPELTAELAGRDVLVETRACDVADRAAVASLRDGLTSQDRRVRAVIHAAGVVDMVPIEHSDLSEWDRVCAAKVLGAIHLDEVFGDELDEFVVFSSNAGVWGSAGQSAYAAANAFVDGLVRRRRDRGAHGLSVAWGAWGGVGMAAGERAVRELTRIGVRPMAPDLALGVLARAIDGDETFLAVADVDWTLFATAFTAARARPLIGEIPEVAATLDARPAVEPVTGLTEKLKSLSRTEQEEHLLRLVTTQAAAVLRYSASDTLDPTKAFRDLGFDSLTAVDLRNDLARITGLPLPTTVIFDHPNAVALSKLVHQLLVPTTTPDSIHADLNELEDAVAAIAADTKAVEQIALRLRRIAATLTGEDGDAAGADDRGDLESADADELLSMIQSEFGRP